MGGWFKKYTSFFSKIPIPISYQDLYSNTCQPFKEKKWSWNNSEMLHVNWSLSDKAAVTLSSAVQSIREQTHDNNQSAMKKFTLWAEEAIKKKESKQNQSIGESNHRRRKNGLKKFSEGSLCLHHCFSTPVNFSIDMISTNWDSCT